MSAKHKFLFLSLVSMFSFGIFAQTPIKKAFIDAPFEVIPTIPVISRLDMIDYFEHDMQRPSATYFNEEVMITEMDSCHISTSLGSNTDFDIWVVKDKADTLYVVAETLKLPAPDSKVTVYRTDWTPLAKRDAGLLKEWLQQESLKAGKLPDVENALSFMTASATVDSASNTLVFVNTAEQLVVPEEYMTVKPFLKNNRKFTISSKGFKESLK